MASFELHLWPCLCRVAAHKTCVSLCYKGLPCSHCVLYDTAAQAGLTQLCHHCSCQGQECLLEHLYLCGLQSIDE
jgi:hypothetical protein